MLKKLQQFIFSSPLRNKFSLFFVVLAVAPILLLGGSALYLINISHRFDVSSLELQLLNQKTEEIDKFMADTLGIMEIRVSFEQKSEIALNQQGFLLDGILSENKAFNKVSFVSLMGKETARASRIEYKASLEDMSLLPAYKTILSKKNYISNVYQTTNGPAMTLATPVYNKNNEMIQMIVAEVNLSKIVSSIENAKLGQEGYLLIVDPQGYLISNTKHGDIYGGDNISSFSRVQKLFSGTILSGLSPEDYYTSYIDGTPVVGAGKIVSSTGWGLLAEWPIIDANLILDQIRDQVLLLTLAIILSVLLLAPIFASRLTKPIQLLRASALEIEKGNFKKRVEIDTDDELKDLGQTFNNMAVGLTRLQELRDEFVHVMTHELRSPITVVRGYVSMIKDGSYGQVPATLNDPINIISSESDNLAVLINDILEIARFEAGQVKMENVLTDIVPIIKITFNEMNILAKVRNISCEFVDPNTIMQAFVDPQRFKQVITNFISNAIKYNRDGGSIKISLAVHENMIHVTVADTGIGMSAESQKHLFEKFFRAKTAKEVTGTGLGLFITRQFIQAMGGDIVSILSKENEGTTFTFSVSRVVKI